MQVSRRETPHFPEGGWCCKMIRYSTFRSWTPLQHVWQLLVGQGGQSPSSPSSCCGGRRAQLCFAFSGGRSAVKHESKGEPSSLSACFLSLPPSVPDLFLLSLQLSGHRAQLAAHVALSWHQAELEWGACLRP